MTEYEKLIIAEQIAHTIEIVEWSTGKTGVAQSCTNGVRVFYGADDGSDDKTISPQMFNKEFRITAAILS